MNQQESVKLAVSRLENIKTGRSMTHARLYKMHRHGKLTCTMEEVDRYLDLDCLTLKDIALAGDPDGEFELFMCNMLFVSNETIVEAIKVMDTPIGEDSDD